MHIADRIIEKVTALKNPSIVGIDPRFESIPDFIRMPMLQKHGNTLKAVAESMILFNKYIIDTVSDIVGIVKPQAAFFEMAGHEGMRALAWTVQCAKSKGLIVIMDAKRGDIGSTADGYAEAYLSPEPFKGIKGSEFESDMLTVNPYFGTDGIAPFIKRCDAHGKGIFLLVRTSNPSATEFQDVQGSNVKLYEEVARKVDAWGKNSVGKHGYSSVGAVVGATYPQDIVKLRKLMPHTIFLIPGYGAQGGSADDVKAAFDTNGVGALVNSSRGIINPYKDTSISEKDFVDAVRKAAIAMRDDLRRVF